MDLRLTGRRLACITVTGMLQQMGVEAKALATEDRVNTTSCTPGTYVEKIFIDDEEAMLIPNQVSRDIRGG